MFGDLGLTYKRVAQVCQYMYQLSFLFMM